MVKERVFGRECAGECVWERVSGRVCCGPVCDFVQSLFFSRRCIAAGVLHTRDVADSYTATAIHTQLLRYMVQVGV